MSSGFSLYAFLRKKRMNCGSSSVVSIIF